MNFLTFIYSDSTIVLCKFLDPKDIINLLRLFPKIYKKNRISFQI